MKKNLLIIALIMSAIFLTVFARIQTAEAEKQQARAEALEIEAAKHRQAAENESRKAAESAAEAIRQKILAEKALADCQKK